MKLIKYLSQVKMCPAEAVEENEAYMLAGVQAFFFSFFPLP
jgi:hypothetical protein